MATISWPKLELNFFCPSLNPLLPFDHSNFKRILWIIQIIARMVERGCTYSFLKNPLKTPDYVCICYEFYGILHPLILASYPIPFSKETFFALVSFSKSECLIHNYNNFTIFHGIILILSGITLHLTRCNEWYLKAIMPSP